MNWWLKSVNLNSSGGAGSLLINCATAAGPPRACCMGKEMISARFLSVVTTMPSLGTKESGRPSSETIKSEEVGMEGMKACLVKAGKQGQPAGASHGA